MGLDIYLEWDNMTEFEEKARYSGAAGYLRSSYNSGGFNSWAGRYIDGKDFYYIFNYGGDSGEDWTPAQMEWDSIEQRAKEALQLALSMRDMPVIINCHSHLVTFANEAEALEAFLQENAGYKKSPSVGFGNYSNRYGDFFFSDCPVVLGVMAVKGISGNDTLLICKNDSDAHKYYIDVLENEVLAFIKLGREKKAKIIWSG